MRKCVSRERGGVAVKLVALTLLAALTGCASELDTQREPVDTGSFGHTVMTLVCKRVAYLSDLNDGDDRVDVRGDTYRELCRAGGAAPADAPAQLRALQAARPSLEAALDAMLPEPFLDELQAYVTTDAFLSMYDDGTAVNAAMALAGALDQVADDDQALQAIERLALRTGYAPSIADQGVLEVILDYPELPDVLLHTTAALAPGGSAHQAWTDLSRALSATLRNAEAADDPDAPDRVATLALELLFGEHPLLDTEDALMLAPRDRRGLARVMPTAQGALPSPFVDTDGDGLADVDPLGRFVDAGGQVIDAPAPFAVPDQADPPWVTRDSHDRAIHSDLDTPVYQYLDLDQTLFAALGRDGAAIVDPEHGAGVDALVGVTALMGPRQRATRTYASGDRIDYTGFDTEGSALLDMLYGYLLLLTDPDIYDTLDLARTLLRSHEPELARLVEALASAADAAGAYPGVSLEPGSPLFDDLVPVVRDILATPGLFEDIMAAMEEPGVANLGQHFANYMTYRDMFTYDPDTQEVIGAFATPVDRDAPNSGFNRSVWQRVLHLVDDANGVPLCNKHVEHIELGVIEVNKTYAECALFRIDNLAVFFVRSLGYLRDDNGEFVYDAEGQPVHAAHLDLVWDDPLLEAAVTDEVMELATGIDGFGEHPTPQALSRTLFLQPSPPLIQTLIDPPRTRYDELFTERHGGTLPAWELGGFYEQVQPLVQPFVDHEAEALFVELLVVLHRHWPARDSADHQQEDANQPGYAWASNVAGYEPIIADILGRGDLWRAVTDSAPVLNAVQVNGRSFAQVAHGAAEYFLTPQPGLADRRGRTTSVTSDGRPVDTLSIWHILADAYAAKRALFAEHPERGQAWDGAISHLIDVLGRGVYEEASGWRFANPRLRGVGLTLVDFLEDRLRAHDAAGTRQQWLTTELPSSLEDLFGGPVVAALADLVVALDQQPEARRALEGLLAYMLSEDQNGAAFRGMLVAMADIAHLAALNDANMVPLARVIGRVMDPERGWMDALLAFALGARAAEGDIAGSSESTLLQLLQNGVAEHRAGQTPLGDIIDGVAEVHRARPYEELDARYTSDDYRALFRGVARFIDEEKRGLRRFLAIIEGRNIE